MTEHRCPLCGKKHQVRRGRVTEDDIADYERPAYRTTDVNEDAVKTPEVAGESR